MSVYRDVRVSAVKRSGLAPAMLHKRSIPAVRIPDEKTNLSASRSRRAALTPSVREGSVGSAAGPGKVEICPVRTTDALAPVSGSRQLACDVARARHETNSDISLLAGALGPAVGRYLKAAIRPV